MAKEKNSLVEKFLKNSKLKYAKPLNHSILTEEVDAIVTDVPALNIAFSGRLDGGLMPGFHQIAGPSKHFKSSFGLVFVSSFLKQYDDGVVLFFDSEFGASMKYFERFGIGEELRDRVIHLPFENLEQLKFELVGQLDAIERGEHVMIFIDSIGLSASKKELEDALAEKGSADMTRAKQLSSIARMITPILSIKKVPCLVVNHVYKTQEMFSKDVVSGGCVEAGTKIIMADGTLRNIEDVLVGDTVKTKDGDKPVTSVWNPDTLINGTPECYEIEFEDGYKVVCSDKHKFLVGENWIEAKDLEKNTKVLEITKSPTPILIDSENIMERMRFPNLSKCVLSVIPVGKLPVYDISVADSESYVLENGVITHNTKLELSSQNILLLSRSKEKDSDNTVTGFTFNIKIMKSRAAKEDTRVPVTVSWDGGIHKWSGMSEIASILGVIEETKISRSKAFKFVKKDGTDITVKESQLDTHDEFWTAVLKESNLAELIENAYTVGGSGDRVEQLISKE